MTDDVQRQITWLLCFDDGEADHIGAARCAETMKSQQARIESLEAVLVKIRDYDIYADGIPEDVKHVQASMFHKFRGWAAADCDG